MARRVEGVTIRRPNGEKYPWDEWLNGATWALEEGVDFQASVNGFRVTAHAAARRHNKIVRTSRDGMVIYIRAYEKEQAP